VAAEVRRLAPKRIYVVGGSAVLGNGVLTSLSSIAPTERLGGADRYATGLRVNAASFTSSAHAVIATGRAFPDALAATGAAGARQAPVILVNGALSTLPASTLSTLSDLGVASVAIAGGTGAVSAGIESQLRARGFAVSRYGGSTRYETAALLNNAYFPPGSSSTTFLATGLNFPDALAGAAIAGRLAAPLYVTRPDCTPPAVHDSISALGASARVVMGGTSVVSAAAAANTECVAPPPPPPPPSIPPNPGDSVNCSDFSTWTQAQAWFLKYYPHYGDVARLDADNDGIACESLPGAP
jgi:putative cell wall-binding protein